MRKMLKEKFLKAYANLPPPERELAIAIIDGEPFSWNRAYHEIIADTEIGKEILEKMHLMEII